MPSARKTLDALINLFVPDIRSAFLAAMQDVVSNVVIKQVIEAIQTGDVEGAFRALGFSPAALRPIIAAIERAYEQGGIMTGETFPKYLNTFSGRAVFRFDVRNIRAEQWLRNHSSSLISRITDETRVNVQSVLIDGMAAGRNPRSVALDIVGRIDPGTKQRVGGIVGLTNQQATWVANAQRDLLNLDEHYFTRKLRDKRFDGIVRRAIDSGQQLTRDDIDKLITRYKDRLLKHRGDMIARTEALQSLSASEYEAVKQAVDLGAASEEAVKRIWDDTGDNRVRWSHRRMRGQAVGLNEPFVSPSGARMMHPGDTSLGAGADEVVACRCRARTEINWLHGVV